MNDERDGDPWSLAPPPGTSTSPSQPWHQADAPSPGRVVTEIIGGVTPLDAQFGMDPKKTVPDTLQAALFGGHRETGHGTYAVLDAARITNLPELVATSDLTHKCLYTGQSEAELGNVAPWLVELEPDHAFTRSLFTQSEAPWHLWDRAGALFLRAPLPFPAIWSHLRKFTRIQDESGTMLFFRFWEARVLGRYMMAHHAEATGHILRLLGGATFLCPDLSHRRVVVARADPPGPGAGPQGPWPHLSSDLADIRLEIYGEDFADRLARDIPPLADVPRAERQEVIATLIAHARRVGFHIGTSVERYCLAAILLGAPPEADKRFFAILQSPQHELDRSRKMLKLAKALTKGT